MKSLSSIECEYVLVFVDGLTPSWRYDALGFNSSQRKKARKRKRHAKMQHRVHGHV